MGEHVHPTLEQYLPLSAKFEPTKTPVTDESLLLFSKEAGVVVNEMTVSICLLLWNRDTKQVLEIEAVGVPLSSCMLSVRPPSSAERSHLVELGEET